MFTGIVQHVGRVAAVRRTANGARLVLELGPIADGLTLGASVAVNGACLTVATLDGAAGGFDVIPETLRATTLGALAAGDRVNLEPALRVGDPLDGHFVQGHIDGAGTITRVQRSANEVVLWTRTPAAIAPYIVRKGSIAIDGTSLTIADVRDDEFAVALIPTTIARTTLGERTVGDGVNLESDILARMIVAQFNRQTDAADEAAAASLGWEHLRQTGFLA